MPHGEPNPSPAVATPHWRIALDTGGTFTDLVGVAPDGSVVRAKVPSDGTLVATIEAVGERQSGGLESSSSGGSNARSVDVSGDAAAGGSHPRQPERGRTARGSTADAGTGDPRLLRVRWPAGLRIPDGLLAGWSASSAQASVGVEWNAGDSIRLVEAWPSACGAGEPLRLVPPAGLVDAPRLGMHLLTGTPWSERLPDAEIRLSTTRGTNALLEGRGAKVGVLVSDALEGVVTIGDQTRAELFARVPSPRRPLAHAVRALEERTLAGGEARLRADDAAIADAAGDLVRRGCDTLVVSLAHALVDGGREEEIAATLRAQGFHARAATAVSPHPRLLTRTDTATVAARIAPTLEAFVADARRSAAERHRAFVFTSAGVLQDADRFEPRDTLFSGPAGGAEAVARVAQRHGLARAVGFDMGGTSSDVCRVSDGRVALRRETRLAGATVAAPALAIDSVAAGGGSICRVRDGALEVGPDSAGASPGPACYGRGGPLAVSDLNLLAGRLAARLGSMPVDRAASARALDAVAAARGLPSDEVLAGLLDLANARMALAIENLCVRDGVDPRGTADDGSDGHALVAFGGAGGQHACPIAERLGISTVVFPRAAGFLSAEGVLAARAARFAERPVLARLADGGAALAAALAEARRAALDALRADGFEPANADREPSGDGHPAEHPTASGDATVLLRLVGQEASIEVPFDAVDRMHTRFAERFEALYGYAPPDRALEIEAVRVEVFAVHAPMQAPTHDAMEEDARDSARSSSPTHDASQEDAHASSHASSHAPSHRSPHDPTPPASHASMHETSPAQAPRDARHDADLARQRILTNGGWREARVVARDTLRAGDRVEGPAVLADLGDTAVIDEGWCAELTPSGDLVARRTTRAAPRAGAAEGELFAARLESIALGMGHVLERTALSPNIRDRLDFSCAVLDADGTLVQNAPHLPVHLGALGVATRAVARALDLAEGDVAVVNHPAFGGSHLPDVTTVAPVHLGGARVGYVAVRAHHAEIGGTRPGSFPPDARSLAEEGVVLAPFLAVSRGAFDRDGARARFAGGPHPSRNPDENLADLEAQLAATRHGVDGVRALAAELGAEGFARRAADELARAERALLRAVAARPPAARTATRLLDDGTPITASVAVADGRLRIAIASPVARHPRNFNAPRAVTQAAAMYALRLFVDEPVAMNEGLLRAVDLEIAPSMLAPAFDRDPARCPPVVAGNVETSQTVVAVLVEALGLSAESQSTMNNVLFGNAAFGVYETLGGGAGAGPAYAGASAVHVHMSNTRLTDVEVLERRAPVIVRAFRVRAGSGGAGRHPGGDGLVRSYEFRTPVSLSFFGSRRVHAPAGMAGGAPGACGTQHATVGGRAIDAGASVLSLELGAGDVFTVETPGGGGWGAPAAGG